MFEKSSSFIKGMMAGAVVGTVALLMVNPQNQKMLKKRTNKLMRAVEDAVDNLN